MKSVCSAACRRLQIFNASLCTNRSAFRSFRTSAILNDEGGKGDGGWFSRLLGVQSIEPMKASHSSLLADKDIIYELVTHKTRPGVLDDYTKVYENHVTLLKSRVPTCELVGSWKVVVGNQDQSVHLWRYSDGYNSMDQTLELVQSDKDLRSSFTEQSKLCTKRKNVVMCAFSFWGDPKPRPPKHLYELRSYVLKPGTMIEWGNNWARGINYRRDFQQDVGGFFSQIGQLYMVFHLWAYESLSVRKKIREETWRKPGWDTNVAYTVPLIKEMDSKLMVPNKFSPLQ